MRYLGGKHKLAKHLVAAIRGEVGSLPVWDPFCGGLSMAVEFAKTSTGIASDVHAPLIALYQAVRNGWDPPVLVTQEMYAAARLLPDSDPLKAFAGFGCSFGGKWFGGYARSGTRSHAAESRNLMLLRMGGLAAWRIERASFFDQRPGPLTALIYCDPPYAGTAGYSTGAFDHDRFWARSQEWAGHGVPVYVSEFACPVPHRLVLEIPRKRAVAACSGDCVDRLYRVL